MITDAVADALREASVRTDAEHDAGYALLPRLLFFAAKRNLANLLVGEKRRHKREEKIARKNSEICVTTDPLARILLIEDERRAAADAAEMLAALEPLDREIFTVWLSQHCTMEAFATLLGIAHLSVHEQRQHVRRRKKRIIRRVRSQGLLI